MEAKLDDVMTTGGKAFQAGRLADATRAMETAAGLVARLYPDDEYPRGPPSPCPVSAAERPPNP